MCGRLLVAVVAVVAVVVPATAQEFLLLEGLTVPATDTGCRPQGFTVPALVEPWNIRMSVVADPPGPFLDMSFYYARAQPGMGTRTIGVQGSTGGYLEVAGRLPAGPSRQLVVCVGPRNREPLGTEVAYTVSGHWIGNADRRAPTASDEPRAFDDGLYRDLIFNGYHDPAGVVTATSRVLYNPSPQFYIRLGGPDGCGDSPRVPYSHVHYWRAIVPILAAQLTAVPYQHTVEAGCEPREARPEWVTVEYTTPDEEGGNWAGRALLGATAGRIWIRWNSTRAPAGHPATDPGITAAQRETIAHEIGHGFGLRHTQREDALMDPDGWFEGDRYLFTPAEEDVARRAYRAGRGARYCGDPDECGNGQPSGFRWYNLPEWPVIVVED